MKDNKRQRKDRIKLQNEMRKLFGVDAFRKYKLQCRYEFECNVKPEYIKIIENKPVHLCKRHYIDELMIDLELWEEENGSFCLICSELVEYATVRDQSLPCLCEKHMRLYNSGSVYIHRQYKKRMKELE